MSTKNNNGVAAQALLDMDAITSALKEESKKSLNALLTEAVKNALREGCEEDVDADKAEQVDDKSTEDSKEAPIEPASQEAGAEETPAEEGEPAQAEEPQEAETEAPAEGSEWDEYSDYQVGDNAYDLTGEKDHDKVMKVYKLLTDDDNVVVKQDGSTIQLKDGEAGTEYVIDLGTDEQDEPESGVEGSEEAAATAAELNESDIAGFGDEEGQADDKSDIAGRISALQKELDDLRGDSFDGEMEDNNIYESKKSRKPMKESKNVLFEVDLGYTDNYQDKDPIAGLSNDEPSKNGKSWDEGLPKGTEKPWAGEAQSKGEPFEKTIKEEELPEVAVEDEEGPVEEGTNVGGAVQQRTTPKSHIPAGRKENGPKVKHHVSTESEYNALVAENKALKAQNKELKEAVLAIRKNLSEAYVTNANLGKITRLFLENTTSQAEKVEIVNRFTNEAKTIEQSKALYESINRELKKPGKMATITESTSATAKGSQPLNEAKNSGSPDLIKTIDLMNRVMNC